METRIRYKFSDRGLLERALTHSSHANEAESAVTDNEQFEFLGDAVLGFITSLALIERYPSFAEGRLSKLRAHLVSAKHLAEVAKSLGIGEFLRLGRGEERTGGRQKTALLVDALEATVAAIYLDGGIEPARAFILSMIVHPELEQIDANPERGAAWIDQKSALQEITQAMGLSQPEYAVVGEQGPDHNKTFTVELRIRAIQKGEDLIERADGRSKKIAEQKAAEAAMSRLQRAGSSEAHAQ